MQARRRQNFKQFPTTFGLKWVKTHHTSSKHFIHAKVSKQTINPPAKIFPVPRSRFTHLHVDVVGPLPPSEGMSYILSIICCRTRWVECIPIPTATSKNCANAFIRGWLQRFGACEEIVADNGNTFQAGLWLDLNRILGIKVKFIPPYHQSTNGALERQHRTIKESLKASLIDMGNTHRDQWMQQWPFTMLGRMVAFQPDLEASSADLLKPDEPLTQSNHELLKTLQINASQDPIPMSRHRKPDPIYMPSSASTASHVYIKIHKPENLGHQFQGPFRIVNRPSNTTVELLVGYNKQGEERREVHHWNNCQVAHVRPGVPDASRPDRGRPKNINGTSASNDFSNATEESQQTFYPPYSNLERNYA